MSTAAAGWPPTNSLTKRSQPPRSSGNWPPAPSGGASWLQRARTNGLVHLDLTQPEQLDLLRRYGPFATDTRVWLHGDPTPVIETGDSFGDLPRFTYRLDPVELEHAQALLAEAGLAGSILIPALHS